MKNRNQNTRIIEQRQRRNQPLAIYIMSITTVVLTYSFYMAQIHL